MNFLKKFIKASPTDELALIPSGKLFLARSPLLPKGALECLYNDSLLAIKQTTTQYCYQLQIIKAYQEGELSSESADGDDEDEENEAATETSKNGDERLFFLSDELKVRIYTKHDSTRVIAWRDLNGDLGDRFEFAVDEEVRYNEVDNFMLTLYRCLYEQKYEKSSAGVSDEALKTEFQFNPKRDSEGEEISVSRLRDLQNIRRPRYLYHAGEEDEEDDDDYDDEYDDEHVPKKAEEDDDDEDGFKDALSIPYHIFQKSISVDGIAAIESAVELRIYDADAEEFKLLTDSATVKIVLVAPLTYSLVVDKPNFAFLAHLSQEMNPVFNYEHFAFIFNHYVLNEKQEGSAYSLMFKFQSFDDLEKFQKVFFSTLYETVTKAPLQSVTLDEMDFVTDAFGQLEVSSEGDDDYQTADSDVDDPADDEEKIQKIQNEFVQTKESRASRLFVPSDSEDEEDEEDKQERKFRSTTGYKNSGLSVGLANDRTYVTRGDSLGVYGDKDGSLSYVTSISNFKDSQGKQFVPKKTMLHDRDNVLLLTSRDETDTNIYKMDLSRGQIVDTWDADGKEKLKSFAPVSKFAPLSGEQMLTGISANSLFYIDPRLSGKKIVNDKTFKGYKTTRNNFENVTVTGQGYVAVGLQDGTVRLYNKLGGNAKAALPALGQNFVGIDVTKDGRWFLGTCKTYLLLVDLKVGKGQKNEGSLGFEKYFDADKKPVPKRLTLRPEHLAMISRETNKPTIEFTHAMFNTLLEGSETSIVTSTGPFVITWSLTNIKKNPKRVPSYTIHRYDQVVVADSFKFSSNNEIITALQDDVAMMNKQGFRAANKKSFGL